MKALLDKSFGRAYGALRRRAEALLQKPAVILSLEYAARFLLTLLLSRARIFGAYAPFGVAMLAASGGGLGGAFALAGGLAGYLLMGGLHWGLRYLVMCVLVYATALVFQESAAWEKSFFTPLTTAAVAAVAGFTYMSDLGYSLSAVIFYITETVLAGSCTLFFRTALSPWSEADPESALRHRICGLILGAAALIALSGIHLAGIISLGRIAAVLAVMIAARRSGMGGGAAAGVALGFAMDAALGRAAFFSVVYAFSGLIAGVFSKQKRLFFTLAYVLANAVAALWAWDSALHGGSLYEVFIASVIFMVLPQRLLLPPASAAGTAARHSLAGLRQFSAWRLGQLSQAFRSLYTSLRAGQAQAAPNDNDLSKVFSRAAALTCRKCRRALDCWDRNYQSTMNAVNDASPAMIRRGELVKEDLPAYFLDRCQKPEAYVAAVNDGLRAALYRRQCRARVGESRAAAISQYREVEQLLASAAQELSEELVPEADKENRLSLYLRGLGVPAAAEVWRDGRGRLRAELSGELSVLESQADYLDKLSAVLGTRLCTRAKKAPNRLELLEAEPLAVSLGVASMRRSGQSVCGDSHSFFKGEDGRFHVLLSDGMGSGEGAAKLSGEAVSILERFLRAGVSPEGALRILSSALVLRGDENGCATADIFRIDLFSAEALSCKCGAAPSYIRSGGKLRRVDCAGAAVGLAGSKADTAALQLAPDDLIVLLSDGVLEGGDDQWLREKLLAFSGRDVKALASQLVSAAMDAHGGEDDMTALCILLSERE